ncbi:DUF2220 family protein [Desulfococcaceae bacterium HSG7]|nr:DUF2220 family protein [Desulfococcaceae bacterium HSG7]
MKRPQWIKKLLETGEAPHSLLPRHFLSELKNLNLVRIRRNKSRQRVEVIHNEFENFERWVIGKFPETEFSNNSMFPRAKNIITYRSSKSGQTTHKVQPVLFKWFDPDPENNWARMTNKYGMVGMTSDKMNFLQLPDNWWLLTIENWESFYPLVYPNPRQTIIVLYTSGNISNITLSSIAGLEKKPKHILHFGDYDWSGLTIFQRIQSILAGAVLYVPDDIEALFRKHARRYLAENQPVNFEMEDPICSQIIRLIERYNGGLEQEIVTPPHEKKILSTLKNY